MTAASLMKAAALARERAYAPYSRFKVGAAVLLEDGSVYSGCNVENAAYGLSMCAERIALFKAVSENKSPVAALAVIAETGEPVTPCGSCRQVMAELCAPHTPVYLGNVAGQMRQVTVAKLLPHAFAQEVLE